MKKIMKFSAGAIATGVILGGIAMTSSSLTAQDALPRCDRNSPDTTTATQRSPYTNTSVFRAALDRVVVFQHPTSSECLDNEQIKAGNIKRGVFYLHTSGSLREMRFRLPSNGRARSRAELRASNFNITANGEMQFDYTIPSGTYAPEFTIGQLLSSTSESDNSISSVPIIRLELQTNSRGVRTLMLAFKPSEDGDTTFQSLGTIGNGVLGRVQIEWRDNAADGSTGTARYNSRTDQISGTGRIRVRHQVGNGAAVTKFFNVSDINIPLDLIYFKAGCYTQEDGACANNIRRLTFRNVPVA